MKLYIIEIERYCQCRAHAAIGGLNKKVDAACCAGSALLRGAWGGLVKLVGPEFNTGGLAFFLLVGSPLRRQVNSALVAMREDGTYQKINEKWFGSDLLK